MLVAAASLCGHSDTVRAARLCAQGDLAATGGDDGTVRVWLTSSSTGRPAALLAQDHAVSAVAWSPDARRLVRALASLLASPLLLPSVICG